MLIYKLLFLFIIGNFFVSCEKQPTNPAENFGLIHNGEFEEISGAAPTDWILEPNTFGNLENYIIVDSVDAFEGNYSLKFHHSTEIGCWEMSIKQILDKSFFKGGAAYRLTLNFKANYVDETGLTLIVRNPTLDLWVGVPFKINKEGEWLEISHKFRLPRDIGNDDITIAIWFCNEGIKSWWLDNIKLQQVI